MLTREELGAARERAAAALAEAGIVLTSAERSAIEVADFGLSQPRRDRARVVVYVNTERVCAKELVLFPGQTCPEHRHPPAGGSPGKEETFRCRRGASTSTPRAIHRRTPPVVRPIPRAARSRSGTRSSSAQVISTRFRRTRSTGSRRDEGAVVSEFSTTSTDELDVFTDPRIRRRDRRPRSVTSQSPGGTSVAFTPR